ncbi:MAG: glycosyltransferase [Porphyromonas sp.]|nr:glycosyltransferase [Porphyromonas sp.]
MALELSFIIPLYNRPLEIEELLESFVQLKEVDGVSYEIIIVEDGSTEPSEQVIDRYRLKLPIRYLVQENQGPSGARNHGATDARGEWLIFLDSDTLLPPTYLENLAQEMAQMPADLWGGPDRAREDFSTIQKAIDYSMTSLLTTGGIRGGSGDSKRVDTYYPRTFNLGVRKSYYERVGGFRQDMRYGEDLDFSMRVMEAGGHSAYYPTIWVYHKRRVSYREFFDQVMHSGEARIELNRLHPGTLKPPHLLPSIFVLYHFSLFFVHRSYTIIPLLIYLLLIVIEVYIKSGSMELAFNAVAATYVQFFGYGIGMMKALWRTITKKYNKG